MSLSYPSSDRSGVRPTGTVGGEAGPTSGRDRGYDLSIVIGVSRDRVDQVHVVPSARSGVAGALAGRPVDQAISTVGMVFAICGRAHTVAALRAVEAGRGHPALAAVEAARAVLVTVEALDQTVRNLMLDVPAAFDLVPDVPALKAVRRDLATVAASMAATPWQIPCYQSTSQSGAAPTWPPPDLGPAVRKLAVRVGGSLPGEGAAPPASASALRRMVRADPGPLGRVLAAALEEPTEAVPPPRVLDGWTLSAMGEALRSSDTEAFVLRPTWRSRPAETGSLARWSDDPLIRDLWTQGAPLTARLVARWLDLTHGLSRLEALARGEETAMAGLSAAAAEPDGAGLAAVETARGLLVHRLAERQGVIEDWQILAPTEWTFHPAGALAATVVGWPARDAAALARRVRLLVAALDPCVRCDMAIEEAGHA